MRSSDEVSDAHVIELHVRPSGAAGDLGYEGQREVTGKGSARLEGPHEVGDVVEERGSRVDVSTVVDVSEHDQVADEVDPGRVWGHPAREIDEELIELSTASLGNALDAEHKRRRPF